MDTMTKPARHARKTTAPVEPPKWVVKLREVMRLRGVSQSALAERIGYPVRRVGKWVHDGHMPTRTGLGEASERIAVALNTSAAWLLDDDADLPPPMRAATAPTGPPSPSPVPQWADGALIELIAAAAGDPEARTYLLGALDLYRQRKQGGKP